MKVAILDLYNGEPNLGLKSITDLLDQRFGQLTYRIYDVRQKSEIADLSYDIYISTGGPGHPLDGVDHWGPAYFALLDGVLEHNRRSEVKKHVFFICHSFQIACHHFGIGKISRRPRESFGIFPVRKTKDASQDLIFKYLPNPFCAADFRKYQVLQPDLVRLKELNGAVLAIEHEARLPHTESALMAFKLGEAIYGVQFHPEAYPAGMVKHISDPKKRAQIIEDHGATVYESMLFQLRDPIKLSLTYEKVLPAFLKFAVKRLSSSAVPAE